jgi:hypothetical protein
MNGGSLCMFLGVGANLCVRPVCVFFFSWKRYFRIRPLVETVFSYSSFRGNGIFGFVLSWKRYFRIRPFVETVLGKHIGLPQRVCPNGFAPTGLLQRIRPFVETVLGKHIGLPLRVCPNGFAPTDLPQRVCSNGFASTDFASTPAIYQSIPLESGLFVSICSYNKRFWMFLRRLFFVAFR